jgi:hypothetical protein
MASIILVWERGLELGLGAGPWGAAGAAGTENDTVQGMGLAGNALCISGLPGMGGLDTGWRRRCRPRRTPVDVCDVKTDEERSWI